MKKILIETKYCHRFTMYTVADLHNVRLFPIFHEKKEGCDIRARRFLSSFIFYLLTEWTQKRRNEDARLVIHSIHFRRENKWRKHRRFDESLVRNGRLHRAPYCRRRAREIYETAGIVRHVTETKKRETIRPFRDFSYFELL